VPRIHWLTSRPPWIGSGMKPRSICPWHFGHGVAWLFMINPVLKRAGSGVSTRLLPDWITRIAVSEVEARRKEQQLCKGQEHVSET